jgi:Mrp family chromosome partitioning ATPase
MTQATSLFAASSYPAPSALVEEPEIPADAHRALVVNPEFLKLLDSVEAMKSREAPFILQFLAATPGEGTTTVARGFAASAASETGRPTLIINCNDLSSAEVARNVPSLLNALVTDPRMSAAIVPVRRLPHLCEATLSNASASWRRLEGADTRALFEYLKKKFSVIVLDCAGATACPDSLALSRFCDGTVLVVRAEYSRRRVINWTRDEISRYGGNVVGTVLTHRRKYIPDWLYRHLR